MVVVPCMNCSDRHINCHSTCEKYNDYKEDKEVENKAIRKSKVDEGLVSGFFKDRADKNRKKYPRY